MMVARLFNITRVLAVHQSHVSTGTLEYCAMGAPWNPRTMSQVHTQDQARTQEQARAQGCASQVLL